MILFLNPNFIMYLILMIPLGLLWLLIVARVLLRKNTFDGSSKDIDHLQLISVIGIAPFLTIWLLVTPILFGDSTLPIELQFISFQYWPETLLCIIVVLILSDRLVKHLILSKY